MRRFEKSVICMFKKKSVITGPITYNQVVNFIARAKKPKKWN